MIRRTPCSRAVMLALAGALWLPAAAEDEVPSGSGDANADAAAPQPAPPVSVVVEATPPYLPTTNTIAARLPLPWRLTPANVGSVSDLLLADQYAFVLGDALENVSGVNVQTQSGLADYFLIRGFDSLSSSLVLTDGAPEPEVTFYQTYNVDRVEVLKGPGGFLYGRNPLAGALAGVVNIVRRQPQPGTFGRAGISLGSFDTYDATLDYNASAKDGRFGVRLNSTWRQSDFYRDDKENRTLAVNPAFTWRIGSASSLNLNLEYVDTEYEPDSGLPLLAGQIPDVPRRRSYQSPFDASDQQIGRVQVDFESVLSDSWTLRNKTYGRGLDWDTQGTIFNGVFPSFVTGRPEVSRTLTILDDRQRFVGNLLEAALTASTGSVKHRLLTGLDVARFGDEFTVEVALPPFFPGIDLFDPVETAQEPLFTIPISEGDSRSLVVAPYVIDEMQLSERFHALVGARLDVVDFEDRTASDSRRESDVSPMAGLVFSPSERLSFYANAGRSFGPPPSRVLDDPDPEEGSQAELGAKMGWLDGKVQATVAAYHLRRDNIGIPDDTGVTQQEGDQRSRGIELELAAEPGPTMRAFASYAYNDAELTRFAESLIGVDPNGMPIRMTVDRSGNDPAFAPRHIANLWVSQRFENGLGVGGGGRYVSGQFISEDNAFAIDAYVTLDAAVYYRVKDFDLSLHFKNLTDTEYETRGFGSTSVIPAPPFSVHAAVQYRF